MRRPLRSVPVAVLALAVALLLVQAAPSQAEPATAVSLKGEVVTITVRIDAAGATRKQAKQWTADAEAIWNEAFDRWPYKCVKLHLEVQVSRQPESFEARPDHHRILATRGVNGVVLKPHGDTTDPLEHATDGAWGDLPEAGFAHEVGHLMGLGDDYTVVSEHPRVTKPLPGREHTLMADGGPIDKALIDRLGALLAQALDKAGKTLPSCWTGTIDSHNRWDHDTRLAAQRCTGSWHGELTLRVGPDGKLAGQGSAHTLGQPTCEFAGLPDANTTYSFDLTGQADPGRLTLQPVYRRVGGGTDYAGFGPAFFGAPGLRGRSFVVPVTGGQEAQRTFAITWSFASFSHGSARITIRLTCEECQKRVG